MKISIIGCGNMGMTYARSFLQYHKANKENLVLVEKNEESYNNLKNLNIAKVSLGIDNEVLNSDVIILAVKPQDLHSVENEISGKIKKDTLVISILAGIKIERLKKSLAHNFVVRAMPNMPAQYGMGITAYIPSNEVNIHQISTVENLLSTTGRTFMIDDENLMDGVTAISGSGPAYFYFIVMIMIEAAKKMGFDESLASLLVMQTMHGAYHVINNSNTDLATLIKKVSSKGGTTEAAFNILNEKEFAKIFTDAIKRAEERSKELSGS
jgi:pyrroline-5-carboxylate reductase